MAVIAVDNICAALQAADPENADAYRQNADDYQKRLQALDKELEQALADVKKAPFVTFHNAFPYFIRRYDLTLAAVVEESPDVSPSPKQQKRIYDAIRESGARVLFTEPQFSAKLAHRISTDLSIPLAELDPLETGPFEKSGYEDALRENLEVLLKHLK